MWRSGNGLGTVAQTSSLPRNSSAWSIRSSLRFHSGTQDGSPPTLFHSTFVFKNVSTSSFKIMKLKTLILPQIASNTLAGAACNAYSEGWRTPFWIAARPYSVVQPATRHHGRPLLPRCLKSWTPAPGRQPLWCRALLENDHIIKIKILREKWWWYKWSTLTQSSDMEVYLLLAQEPIEEQRER